MIVEGVGEVRPQHYVEDIDNRRYLERIAAQRVAFRTEYRTSSDAWKRGFTENSVLIGLYGEQATVQYLNRKLRIRLRVDAKLRRHGDGGADVVAFGHRVQVKTQRRHNARWDYLIRRLGRNLVRPLDAEYYVFCSWEGGESVRLHGWVFPADVRRYGTYKKSPVAHADHYNTTIRPSVLRPMPHLAADLGIWRRS